MQPKVGEGPWPAWISHSAVALGIGLSALLGVGSLAGQTSAPDTTSAGSTSPTASGERSAVGATRLESSITLDGILDEADWARADVATGFVAQQPTEGAAPSEPTEVRVLFDDEALYIGARMLESEVENIRSQLVRRDQDGQYDYFAVLVDSNLDRRTGFYFQVSPHGVQSDRFLYDDTQQDASWDAVWDAEVAVDDRGWSAEIRIPFSQLRYEPSSQPRTWGINFFRRRVVSNEVLHFQLVSRLQQGLVSQFGELTGMQVTQPPGSLEFVPYLNTTTRSAPAETGNPFFDGRASSASAGGDLRWSLGGNFSLNATFNPDFGQVESDPAVINLTAFETFFPERRQFFVENRQLFDFGLSGGTRLFFSRRIGLSPRGRAPGDADFSDIPVSTRILGAGKLTGRTAGGWSLGLLTAVTREEKGRAYWMGEDRFEVFSVEPRTYWGVAGLQRDYNDGDSQIGALLVGMNRDLDDGASYGALPSTAFGAGVNFVHRWGNREWFVDGFFGATHVRGTDAAILRIQMDPTHYFQRPDARWTKLDPEARSLSGVEWRVRAGRQRGDHWTGEVWLGEVHPSVALNDFGFSRDPESINLGARISYQDITPGDLFRSYQMSLFTTGDWSHDLLDDLRSTSHWDESRIQARLRVSGNLQLLNFWRINPSAGYFPAEYSRTATRGGPVMKIPGYYESQISFTTDERRVVSLRPSVNYNRYREGAGYRWGTSLQMQIRPQPNLEFELGPSFQRRRDNAQYASRTEALPYEPTFGPRYLFADVDRRELSMEMRMDMAFTRNLTLQMFAQPLVASADYVGYKQLSEPSTFEFERFSEGTFVQTEQGVRCEGGRTCEAPDHTRYLDLDGNGFSDVSFRDLDFNIRSLILNSVLRWEFRSGSTLYLVWQRFQDHRVPQGDFSLRRDLDELLSAPIENVLSLKVTYWVGM